MGKRPKSSRKGKKAWTANTSTEDIDEFIEKSTKEALTGGSLTHVPTDSLFFVDESKDLSVKRKIEKHREKVLRCDSVLKKNTFVNVVPSSSLKKGEKKKNKKSLNGTGNLVKKDVVTDDPGMVDIWENENAGEDDTKSRKASQPSVIPPVEVEPPGCSFNPPFEAHHDSLAQVVAKEMQKVYKNELGPQPVPLTIPGDGKTIDEEDIYFLEANEGSDNDTNEQNLSENEDTAQEKRMTEHHMLHFHDVEEISRFMYVKNIQFGVNRFLDWSLLRELGLSDQLHTWTSIAHWDSVFSIREDTYIELTQEFLTTYKLVGKNRGTHQNGVVNFRMGGRRYSMSVDEFAGHLGIPVPQTLHLNASACKFPRGVSASHVWHSVTTDGGLYISSRAKTSKLNSPALRVLQRLLAFTVNGRARSIGGCSTQDLLCIYSMTQGYPIHLGYYLANGIFLQGTRPRDKTTFAGPYITRLAKGMGIFADLPPLTRVRSMAPLSGGQLTRAGIATGYAINNRTVYTLPGAPPPYVGARPVTVQRDLDGDDDDDHMIPPATFNRASSTASVGSSSQVGPSYQAQHSSHVGPSYLSQDQFATLRTEMDKEIDARLDKLLQHRLTTVLAGLYQHFGIPPPAPSPPSDD